MKRSGHHFVVCIDNSEYPASLEIRKLYRILPDSKAEKTGHIRVIDESGEDYLYPGACFAPVQLPLAAEKALSRSI